MLQEEFVTIRNERFVVPVIAGQRRKIDGVIHGASSSGHTLFVEPLETIDLNNELVRLTEEEMREVHRILREMTERAARLRRLHPRRRSTTMAELELIFAKGALRRRVRLRRSRASARRTAVCAARKRGIRCSQDVLRRQRKRVVPISLRTRRRAAARC